ncbi:MAG: hypothetical protein AAGF12_39555 [Myxococcota bacterium]
MDELFALLFCFLPVALLALLAAGIAFLSRRSTATAHIHSLEARVAHLEYWHQALVARVGSLESVASSEVDESRRDLSDAIAAPVASESTEDHPDPIPSETLVDREPKVDMATPSIFVPQAADPDADLVLPNRSEDAALL